MSKTKENVIAFYADDGAGTYDELIIDFYNRNFEFNYETKEKFLSGRGGRIPEIKISYGELHKILDVVDHLYNGSHGRCCYLTEEEIEKIHKGKPVIDKNTLRAAIKRELCQSELDRIISFDYVYEGGDYYDYGQIMKGVRGVMAGEISVDYFKSWLILLMRCLYDSKVKDADVKEEYDVLADWFDGFAFMSEDIGGEEKLKKCREIIAVVKDANHKIVNLKNGKNKDFTTNGVITYVTFAFSLDCGETSLDRVCIVDKNRRRINYMYVEEVDYREDINYTLLSEAEFDDLSSIYSNGYKLDPAMPADYAADRVTK